MDNQRSSSSVRQRQRFDIEIAPVTSLTEKELEETANERDDENQNGGLVPE